MTIERWIPCQTYSHQEEAILKSLRRTRKLFAFLRDHRHELFDDEMQSTLESMYRNTGAGKDPVCPARMAVAALMQGYLAVSDAEAVQLTMVDLRWQMVLGCLGSTEEAFSQGAFQEFRQRLIRHDIDRVLLEKTIALARTTKAFDYRQLPKDLLRVAIDSSPLEGAGRVEDTVNLLAHAGRKIVDCIAALLSWPRERVCTEAGIPLLAESSVKKALDYTWSDPADKAEAVSVLVGQLSSLEGWIRNHLPGELTRPPLEEHIETLHQIMKQDLEPDPTPGGDRSDKATAVRVRDGVAPDRRVSIEDKEMRHGRKSKSKRFNGFKRHLALDLDTGMILACAMTPGNRPDEVAADPIRAPPRDAMRIFEPLPLDDFEWVNVHNPNDYEILVAFDDQSVLDHWKPVRVRRVRADARQAGNPSDFPWLASQALVMRRPAMEALRGILKVDGEILPLATDDDVELFVFNARVKEAMDEARSWLVKFPGTNRIMQVKRIALIESAIQGVNVFRLPHRGSATYVSQHFVDRVTSAGLSGLQFNCVWTSEEGPQ